MTQHELTGPIQHHIQREIVRKLLLVPSARFRDLKPKELESNLFMYHLKQLISNGFVCKTDEGYELTSAGKDYANRATLENLRLRVQPKQITILMVQREDGKLLLLERLHQPFLHFKGFPSGKIHFGESLQQAAQRELQEKANIHGVALQLRGNFIMRFGQEGFVTNHINGYVFSGTVPRGFETVHRTDMFCSYWGDESDLFVANSFSGHKELLRLLKDHQSGDLFLEQHDFLSDY